MAGIIRTLFKSKKSKKEEQENNEDLARDISNRRSYRGPSSSSSSSKGQRRAVARFADDGALSATAAYHTNNAPKLRKGPQSCPGGYRDESDVSYEEDKFSQKSSGPRRRDILSQSMRQNYTIDEGGRKLNGSRRHNNNSRDFKRRGESSEYGSGDPSPVGHFSSRHSTYDDRLEESENDDFSDKAQLMMVERSQQYYMQKYKESEQRRREDRKKLKEKEKECAETVNNLYLTMNQLEKAKKERDHYKKEMNRFKKQLEMMSQNQLNGFDSFHLLRQSQGLQNPQQYPPPLSMTPYSYMNQPMNSANFMMSAPPSSNTPATMTSGAGESLTNPSDISFLQSSYLQAPSQVLSGISSPGFKAPLSYNDEENDEVKDYRGELLIETARSSRRDVDRISLSPSSSADSQVTLLDQSRIVASDKENRKPPTRPFSMMSI